MDLEEYLEGIKNCSDETVEYNGRELSRLTLEWGVYDNFPILLRTNFERVKEFFDQNLSYKERGKHFDEPRPNSYYPFIYLPGTVYGRVTDRDIKLKEPPEYMSRGKKEHFVRQREFNVGIMLHPYQAEGKEALIKGKRMENTTWERALTLVTSDIGRWALAENIPLCLPNSCGWKYHTDEPKRTRKQLSRIVYFEPDKAAP